MKRNPSTAIVLLLLALTLPLFPAQASAVETFKILVVVNGMPITNVDFEEKLQQALVPINQQLEQQGRSPMSLQQLKSHKELTDRILEQYIEDLLLKKEIERLDVTVDEKELDERIDAIRQQRNLTLDQVKDLLAEEGKTLDEFREELRQDLLKHKLIRGRVGKKIVVTESEVMDEYKKRASIQSGVLVHLGYILLPQEKSAADVLKEITDGDKTFAEAADEYSVGPGVGEGGDLGWLDVGDLAADWSEHVADLEPGEISEPFDVGGQQALILLVERKQGEVVVDENLKEQIYEELREEQFQSVLDEYMETIRTQALIQYKNPY